MSKKNIIILSLISCLVGIILYAFARDWIIIRSPIRRSYETDCLKNGATNKKNVTLHVWKNGKWASERTEIVCSEHKADTITQIVTHWLKLMEDEQSSSEHIYVESVLLTPSGTDAYISFDRYPFAHESCIYTKLMWMEGLLKTLRENKVALQGVRFLIHHTTLYDEHLDFSKEWPLTGFME